VVDPQFLRDLDSSIGGTVIDDQSLDDIDVLDFFGEVVDDGFQRSFLVVAGDLDDQFHLICRTLLGFIYHRHTDVN
jgi:hypothetical protein